MGWHRHDRPSFHLMVTGEMQERDSRQTIHCGPGDAWFRDEEEGHGNVASPDGAGLRRSSWKALGATRERVSTPPRRAPSCSRSWCSHPPGTSSARHFQRIERRRTSLRIDGGPVPSQEARTHDVAGSSLAGRDCRTNRCMARDVSRLADRTLSLRGSRSRFPGSIVSTPLSLQHRRVLPRTESPRGCRLASNDRSKCGRDRGRSRVLRSEPSQPSFSTTLRDDPDAVPEWCGVLIPCVPPDALSRGSLPIPYSPVLGVLSLTSHHAEDLVPVFVWTPPVCFTASTNRELPDEISPRRLPSPRLPVCYPVGANIRSEREKPGTLAVH